jgi:hypothetical protein
MGDSSHIPEVPDLAPEQGKDPSGNGWREDMRSAWRLFVWEFLKALHIVDADAAVPTRFRPLIVRGLAGLAATAALALISPLNGAGGDSGEANPKPRSMEHDLTSSTSTSVSRVHETRASTKSTGSGCVSVSGNNNRVIVQSSKPNLADSVSASGLGVPAPRSALGLVAKIARQLTTPIDRPQGARDNGTGGTAPGTVSPNSGRSSGGDEQPDAPVAGRDPTNQDEPHPSASSGDPQNGTPGSGASGSPDPQAGGGATEPASPSPQHTGGVAPPGSADDLGQIPQLNSSLPAVPAVR